MNENGHSAAPARVSSRELAADAVQSVQRLVSLQIALAKQELREIATTNLIAAACIAAASAPTVVGSAAGAVASRVRAMSSGPRASK